MKQYVEIVLYTDEYDLCVTFGGTELNKYGDDSALLLMVAKAIDKVLPEGVDHSAESSLGIASALFGLINSAVRYRYSGQSVSIHRVRYVNRTTGHAGICEE